MSAKIKAALFKLSIIATISKVRQILTMLTGNGNFPNPPYPIPGVEADVDILEQLNNQVISGNRSSVVPRNTQLEIVRKKVSTLATYVNATAMGDPTMLATSGFEFAKQPAPKAIPSTIVSITARSIQPLGCVKLSWSASPERDYYVIENRIGEMGSWEEVGIATKNHYTISGLAFRQDVYFRVAAVNAAGMSSWSDVAMVVVC